MENYNLNNAPEISIALSKFSTNEQEFKARISNAPIMRNVVETLRANVKDGKIDYYSLDNIIVIPAGDDHDSNPLKAVFFGDDRWGCKLKGTEVDRNIDFQKLPARLKFEAKLICLTDLWLLPKISKLGSQFRKGQVIVNAARLCHALNILSLTHLVQELPRKRFKKALSESVSANSMRNYFIALNTLCDMANTPLSNFGLCAEIKTFQDNSNYVESVNQTYCLPISILSKLWLSHHQYATEFSEDFFKRIKAVAKVIWQCKSRSFLMYKSGSEWHNLLIANQEVIKELHKNHPNLGTSEIIYDPDNHDRHKLQKINMGIRYSVNVQEFSNVISSMLHNFQLAAQSYSGMRADEAKHIKIGGLIHDQLEGWVGIKTIQKKFAIEGGIEEHWAAAPWTVLIFTVARKLISAVIPHATRKQINELPLSLNFLNYLYKGIKKPQTTPQYNYCAKEWCKKYSIVLTANDVREFFQLNPNINDTEKVEAEIYEGAIWPLRSHQPRRSIALHSRRLNLVTGSVLSYQLKHLSATQTEWYSSGADDNLIHKQNMPIVMQKKWEEAQIKAAAEKAVELQNSQKLKGKGGELLTSQQSQPDSAKIYPSLDKAIKLAKRNKTVVKALGNGMYCLNGQSCKITAIIQSAKCNTKCENLVISEDGIKHWLAKYHYYDNLIKNAIEHNRSEAQLQYFILEREFFEDALKEYGVKP